MKLKICGMKFPENIKGTAGLQPDYLGFIFYKKSPRFFDADLPKLPESICRTGVFVNASLEFIFQTVAKYELQAVQLHGEESPEFCSALKGHNLEVIKVFSVRNSFDFGILEKYEPEVDFFLFDTMGASRGGTGKRFNWEILKEYPSETPFFLSGGIGLDQVAPLKDFLSFFKRINKEHLVYGLDVNSKFETKPGLKDTERLQEFMRELETFRRVSDQ